MRRPISTYSGYIISSFSFRADSAVESSREQRFAFKTANMYKPVVAFLESICNTDLFISVSVVCFQESYQSHLNTGAPPWTSVSFISNQAGAGLKS